MPQNPYAPPVADGAAAEPSGAAEPGEIPRDAIRLARLWLVSAAIAFAMGGAAALFIRIELWDPKPTFSPESYNGAFGLHGISMLIGVVVPALFGGVGHVLVPAALRARSGPAVGVGVVAWLAWAAGLAGLLGFGVAVPLQPLDPLAPPLLLVASIVGVAGALAILTAQLGGTARVAWGTAGASTRLVVAGFVGSCGSLALLMLVLLVRGPAFALAPIVGCSVVAAIAAAVHVIATIGGRSPSTTLVAIVLVSTFVAELLAATDAPFPGTAFAPLAAVVAAIAQLVLAVVLVIGVLRSRERWHPAMIYAVLGVAPALIVGGPVQAFLESLSIDVHLHDTYFVVGELHFAAHLVVFALLAATHAWGPVLFGRDAHPGLARVGALFVCGGALRMAWEMLALGHAGMPRRYFTYIEQFEPQHRTATLAALATAVGFVIVLVAWLVGRRR